MDKFDTDDTDKFDTDDMDKFDMDKFDNFIRISRIITAFLLGMLIGILFMNFLNIPSNETHVLYVSQDQIMSCEQERIARFSDKSEMELFYGQPEKAAILIEKIAESYENRKNKVVFSTGRVNGINVRSISREVHKTLIGRLRAESNNKQSKNRAK